MSKRLRGAEMNYSIMEKQVYALVQALKHFRRFVGYSKIVSFLPHPMVKDILSQQECLGIRGKCISRIQEYDLALKLTKLVKVKVQGLAKMLTKGNERALKLEDKLGSR
jgi:hypothetical protein